MGVISAKVEKELGERNFGFEVHEPRHGGEKDCCPRLSPAGAPLPRRWCLGAARCHGRAAKGDNRGATNPFSSMSRFSLLQIDEEVEEPEKSENPTQSFKIHNIVWGRTQLLAIYRYVWMDGWSDGVME